MSADDLERWLLTQLAERLSVPTGTVDPQASFADLGLDSVGALEIASSLQGEWDLTLAEMDMWDYPTPRELAAHLANG
jgi:acyl carrier protein